MLLFWRGCDDAQFFGMLVQYVIVHACDVPPIEKGKRIGLVLYYIETGRSKNGGLDQPVN